MDKDHWETYAACKGMGPNPFFPISNQGDRAAKKTCAVCVVRAQCLDTALRSPWLRGIWGGKNDAERERIRQGWRPAKDLVTRPSVVQL